MDLQLFRVQQLLLLIFLCPSLKGSDIGGSLIDGLVVPARSVSGFNNPNLTTPGSVAPISLYLGVGS